MINPKLGTFPRVDTTGHAVYVAADPVRFLGVTRARTEDGLADPWYGLKVEWDFPEAKFALDLDGYAIQIGTHPSFKNKIDPAGNFGPGNDLFWGHHTIGIPEGTMQATFSQIDDFGAPANTVLIQPNTQYYVMLLAQYDGATNAARSEVIGLSTAFKPTEGVYPTLVPAPVFPWSRT